jgi:N4-gp56 family major capsid protein
MTGNINVGAVPGSGSGTTASFIPEIWSDEVIATYKSNLVMANLVRNLNHAGKKGDSIHIPNPARSGATAKTAGAVVTAITDTAADIVVKIDQHFEWSMYIDDIAEMQALGSMRKFYTDDAGYALAQKVDTKIITDLRASTGHSDIAMAATTDWDASILDAMELLNDNDVPMNDRSLVLSPSAYTALLATDRFTEQQFIGNGSAIKTGNVGSIYGMDVYVSSNVGTGTTEKGILFQKEALVLATQQSVRTQTQYQQEFLADLFTADCVFGSQVVRDTSIVEMSFTPGG